MKPLFSSILLACFLFFMAEQVAGQGSGPFAPPAGQPGTTAIHEDSAVFIGWAEHCEVIRGPVDISDTSKGYASAGTPPNAIGAASLNNGVVSLGDGGKATLSFGDGVVYDGTGPDFAIFENSFSDDFLELAHVEVSSNGTDYFRFPSRSLTDTSSQVGSFGSLDATELYNLAGKYRGGYGTPFDLADLQGKPGLNIDSVTHIRIVDVVGNIQPIHATYDSTGHPVNDPWPTDFSSGGFDLDALGVIHGNGVSSIRQQAKTSLRIYPNPTSNHVHLRVPLEEANRSKEVVISNIMGREVAQVQWSSQKTTLRVSHLEPGVYWLSIRSESLKSVEKVIIR